MILKRFTVLLMLFTFFSFEALPQLIINSSMTPAQMVQNVLIGQGVTVSNVTFAGSAQARAAFTSGTNPINIGFQSGILLSSGAATNAIGPNTSGSISTALGTGSDPQLAALIPNYTVYDATVLEFDFIPVSDTIRFRYVFGSDEYPEFSGSNFNDVFGFFLSGINPLGGMYVHQNLAVLPGTSTPVAINNVNNGTAGTGPCMNCQYYVGNAAGLTIEYDAFTTVLTAWALVFPCMTYHIKLAVGDAGDQIYDSGVFLEANSFMSNSVTFSTTLSAPSIDTVAVEGCNDAIVTFRLPTVTPTARIINYGILGTATNGVDYDTIPVSVTIPAGMDSVNLLIHPIIDSLAEGTEYIVLIVNTSPCTYDTLTIPIKDNSYLETILPTDTVVCDDTVTLEVIASGGRSPYSYTWSTGDSTAIINAYSPVTSWYHVTTTDACIQENHDSIEVIISQPVISIAGDTICVGEQATVSSSTPGAVAWNWSNGGTTPNIQVNPTNTTIYTLVVQDTIGCTDTASAEVLVNPSPVVTISNDTAICKGDSIDLLAGGGTIFNWSNGASGSPIQVAPQGTSTYSVTVTNANGCSDQDEVVVTVVDVPFPFISAPADTICRGETITLTANGGMDYLWNEGSISQAITVTPPQTTSYTVIVSNTNAGTTCSANATFELGVKRCNSYFVPSAFTPDGDGTNDVFGPIGEFKAIDNYEMYIYDRWGRLIFHSSDFNEKWDGTDGNGKQANPGAYIYRIFIQETYAEPFDLSGSVTLIR